MSEPIAAISTAFGQGAIAVLRVSGDGARELAGRVWRGPEVAEPRRAYFGAVVDGAGRVIDQVLLTWFRGPASYTGEDLVEIGCHGGLLVTRKILERLLAAGARVAEPGEFTQRAFLNGKLDLTQAEAVMDLIGAQTDLALRAANEQLSGRLGRRMQELREELLHTVAHLEAYIDFPDEDIDPDTGSALRARVAGVRAGVDALLATADQGRVLREGVRTVIAGAPNVGKSSLLNLLLGFDRAIVSPQAGTTRDTIEEVISLRGLPLRLVDTAGLRAAEDGIEQAGIDRTGRELEQAGLVLEVADASQPRSDFSSPGPERVPSVLILNKCDLPEHDSWHGVEGVRLSCQTGQGREALAEEIERRLTGSTAGWGADLVAINARHQHCLAKARTALDQTLDALDRNEAPEFTAIELRDALSALGDVVGQADADEILGVIFGSFCIGK